MKSIINSHRSTYPASTKTGNAKTQSVRMLIVDDDPIASAVIKKQLELTFPGTAIETVSEPVIYPGFNVYFLDNDFRGEHLAGTLVREARLIEPSSLIVALSTTLTLQEMNQMVNDGCNAVFDKQNPQQSYEAKQVIANYITVIRESKKLGVRPTVPRLVSSLSQLLGQWNQRLSNAQQS